MFRILDEHTHCIKNRTTYTCEGKIMHSAVYTYTVASSTMPSVVQEILQSRSVCNSHKSSYMYTTRHASLNVVFGFINYLFTSHKGVFVHVSPEFLVVLISSRKTIFFKRVKIPSNLPIVFFWSM